jgi:hypothetical protein
MVDRLFMPEGVTCIVGDCVRCWHLVASISSTFAAIRHCSSIGFFGLH